MKRSRLASFGERRLIALLPLLILVTPAFGADVGERKFIRQGMSEGEVFLRIGKPDSESADTGHDSTFVIKRWIYLPARGDSQTITTVVLQQGKVIEVERKTVR